MSKSMYFGTRERMTEINCPSINIIRNRAKWTTSGTYLNGGGFQRDSAYGHMLYTIAWNLMSPDATREIMDYYNGLYGQGVIYFLDAFALRGNVLPLHWSVPRLTVDDAPPFIRQTIRTLSPLSASNNAASYPSASAVYTMPSGAYTSERVWIPVPPGKNFYFGVHGNRTGTAEVLITPDVGTAVGSGTPLSTTSNQLTNLTFVNPGGVTISLRGSGSLTLNSMTGIIDTVIPSPGDFKSGEGHTGVRFDGTPQRTGYSAAIGEGLEGVSSSFKEVGAWL